jgi:gliding motility-associated-like protein
MMKKLSVILLFLVSSFLTAQTSCENAAPFCASGVSGVTFPATTSITTAQVGPNYGCLGSTPNPAWYYLQISNSGNLDILIQGQIVAPPGPGQDVDFICWGPFSSLAGICNSLTAGNTVDCSYSGSFTETLNIPSGVAGEYYLVLITNFANIQQNILFTQFAGTGSTNCSLLSSNSQICAGNHATVVATNSGSLTNPTYSINPGGITNSTGSFVVQPTVTTNYTVYVTGINGNSVAATQTAASTVSVYPQPSVSVTFTNTTCTNTINAFNLGLTFFPASPVPGYTVSWASIPNGILTPTQTILSGAIPAGSYNATITAAGGCSTTASVVLDPEPEPAIISLSPLTQNHIITCFQPTITITSLIATNNYTWSNGIIAPKTGTLAEFTSTATGNWTIQAVNPTSSCTSIQTFTIGINVSAPSAVISPTNQTINCNLTSINSITATITPSINISHQILSPQGGTFSSQTQSVSYLPGGVGIYTHCAINNVNGCSSCSNFTVFSNQGFPTYTVSSPQNFTLGCNSKSVANVSIDGADTNPSGGPVSYTIIGPPTSTTTPSGALSGVSVYSITTPGTWTVITKDNTSLCETRTPISILSNTAAPDISAIVPRQILDCYVPKITLKAQSLNDHVSFLWNFPTTPGSLQGDTIGVNTLPNSTTTTLVANYTLVVTDNNSTCKSASVIPIFQNLFPPKAVVAIGTNSLTCLTSTIVLTNQSSTNIPPLSGFQYNLPVIGYLWDGPSPQMQGQVQTTYVGATAGVYTLTVKDLNNGCISKTTTTVFDNRIYPELNKPIIPDPAVLDCGQEFTKVGPRINGLASAYQYTWTSPAGSSITVVAPGDSAKVNMVGIYKVLCYNPKNGCASSAEVRVINGTLTANMEVQPERGFAPLQVTFYNNSSSSLGPNNISAVWNFGNGTTKTTDVNNLSTTTTFSMPGTYLTTMFIRKGTCLDSVSKRIYVDVPSSLEVPNVFTPNGDNVNDLFFLKTSNLAEIKIIIYDRWGHIVFDSESTNGNISWDGKYNSGKEAAEGTYFYLIKATGKDNTTFDKKGTLTLLR